jgi:hypothetical protein
MSPRAGLVTAISQKTELFKVESLFKEKRIYFFVRLEVLMALMWDVKPCILVVPTCWKNLLHLFP